MRAELRGKGAFLNVRALEAVVARACETDAAGISREHITNGEHASWCNAHADTRSQNPTKFATLVFPRI
jgi:hypothetical protein